MILDVFKTNAAFTTMSLTTAINKLPHVPFKVGEMGLFQSQPVTNPRVAVEEYAGVISLIPTSQRGGPAALGKRGVRKLRDFTCPHIALEDSLLADDILGVRKFGSEDRVEAIAEKVNEILGEHRRKMEVTHEHMRIGALRGKVYDSDGSTLIYDYFAQFGIAETTVDFVFGTTGTDIKAKCLTVTRAIEAAMGGILFAGVHCLANPTWFAKLIAHEKVVAAWDKWNEGAWLRTDQRKTGFIFCGITFEEYRGTIGGVDFIPDDTARFFPVGAPDAYKVHYAPADFVETVNTMGLPIYAKQEPMEFGRGIKMHIQSNPLFMPNIPAALIEGTSSN